MEQKSEKPKKKGHGCLIAFLIAVILIVGIVVAAVTGVKKVVKRVTPKPAVTYTNELLDQAHEDGTLSDDAYVKQYAYLLFDRDSVDKKDKGTSDVVYTRDITDLAAEYKDKLSDDTKNYIMSRLLLDSSLYTEKKAAAPLGTETVYADDTYDYNAKNLTSMVLSDSGRFVVYYTTAGVNAITDADAEHYAAELDADWKGITSLMGTSTDVDFGVSIKKTSKTAEWLQGLSGFTNLTDIESAVPVYIMNTDGDLNTPAYSVNSSEAMGNFIKMLGWVSPDSAKEFSSVYSFHYILIKPAAFASSNNYADEVLAHELTHIFQSAHDSVWGHKMDDAMANYVAAEIINHRDHSDFLSPWANKSADYSNQSMLNGDCYQSGYALFVFLRSYTEHFGAKSLLYLMENKDSDAIFTETDTGILTKMLFNYSSEMINNSYGGNKCYQSEDGPRITVLHEDDTLFEKVEPFSVEIYEYDCDEQSVMSIATDDTDLFFNTMKDGELQGLFRMEENNITNDGETLYLIVANPTSEEKTYELSTMASSELDVEGLEEACAAVNAIRKQGEFYTIDIDGIYSMINEQISKDGYAITSIRVAYSPGYSAEYLKNHAKEMAGGDFTFSLPNISKEGLSCKPYIGITTDEVTGCSTINVAMAGSDGSSSALYRVQADVIKVR